jgi:hypothetical protein
MLSVDVFHTDSMLFLSAANGQRPDDKICRQIF